MKLWFPVFGGEDDPHVCRKWMVKADNEQDALSLAKAHFASSKLLSYLVPYPDRWVGPIFAVQEVSFYNGVARI